MNEIGLAFSGSAAPKQQAFFAAARCQLLGDRRGLASLGSAITVFFATPVSVLLHFRDEYGIVILKIICHPTGKHHG